MAKVSKNGMKLEPLRGFEDEFDAQMKRCRILREIIQALESEPVRRSMAEWQKEIVAGKQPVMTTLDRVPPIR